jgi:hypothetical protein
MARKLRPAIEYASDIGGSAADLSNYGDSKAEMALAYLWHANPDAFYWLSDRLNRVRDMRKADKGVSEAKP